MLRQKDVDNFLSKIKVDESTGCWEWQAGKFSDGYGCFSINRKSFRAHRVSWKIANKCKIPKSLLVCHTCDNRSCVNPQHLFLGSSLDNVRDMIQKGRRPDPKTMHQNRLTAFGTRHGMNRLSEKQVLDIRKRYEEDVVSQRMLAEKFNVSKQLIGRIVRREIWTHI